MATSLGLLQNLWQFFNPHTSEIIKKDKKEEKERNYGG